MGRAGRPKKYDAIADDISWLINRKENKKAHSLLKKIDINIKDGEDRTPLIHAAFSNNLESLNWLLDHGAQIDHQDKDGWCGLHAAADRGHPEIIKALMQRHANPNLIDIHGNGPLWVATHNACLARRSENNIKVLHLLIKAGANKDHHNKYGRSPYGIAHQSSKKNEKIFSQKG